MTPEQAIRAGSQASRRETVRQAFRENRIISLTAKIGAEGMTLQLTPAEAIAVLNALDAKMTEDLAGLGVVG